MAVRLAEVHVQKAVVVAFVLGRQLHIVSILLSEESVVVEQPSELYALEHYRHPVAVDFLSVEISPVVWRIASHGLAFVKRETGIVAGYGPAYARARVYPAQHQRPPASRAFPVFVRVAVEEVQELALAAETAVEPVADFPVFRNPVYREHVDEYSACIRSCRAFHDCSAYVLYFGEIEREVRVVEVAAQPEMWRQPFVGVADEFLIVGAGPN